MRQLVRDHAKRLASEVVEGPVPLESLETADEAFLTNSVQGMLPISRLFDRNLAAPGPVTEQLWSEILPWLESGGTDAMTTVADVDRLAGAIRSLGAGRIVGQCGLALGRSRRHLSQRVMTCLTVSPGTAAEAIEEHASLIVSHHPVLFRAVKRIRADLAETGHLWKLARAGIAIASPHTAFDNTPDGINDLLCRRLGLVEVVAVAGDPDPRAIRLRVPRPRDRSRSWCSRRNPTARR